MHDRPVVLTLEQLLESFAVQTSQTTFQYIQRPFLLIGNCKNKLNRPLATVSKAFPYLGWHGNLLLLIIAPGKKEHSQDFPF
jgi:hypothetical protein